MQRRYAWYGELSEDQKRALERLTRRGADFYVDQRLEGASHDEALRDAQHSYGQRSR